MIRVLFLKQVSTPFAIEKCSAMFADQKKWSAAVAAVRDICRYIVDGIVETLSVCHSGHTHDLSVGFGVSRTMPSSSRIFRIFSAHSFFACSARSISARCCAGERAEKRHSRCSRSMSEMMRQKIR